jgi:hypothetical protein
MVIIASPEVVSVTKPVLARFGGECACVPLTLRPSSPGVKTPNDWK